MNKLRALFALVGVVMVSGVSYQLYLLKPEFGVADAIDAGIVAASVPARLSCQVRIKEACRNGGARPAYATIQVKARKSKPGAQLDFVAFDLPAVWQDCLVPVDGTTGGSCSVLEDGACTDVTVCAANAPPTIQTDLCACSGGPTCLRTDGGIAPQGSTLAAGTWTGAGCVTKYCGPEIAGEQGASWPAGCP